MIGKIRCWTQGMRRDVGSGKVGHFMLLMAHCTAAGFEAHRREAFTRLEAAAVCPVLFPSSHNGKKLFHLLKTQCCCW